MMSESERDQLARKAKAALTAYAEGYGKLRDFTTACKALDDFDESVEVPNE